MDDLISEIEARYHQFDILQLIDVMREIFDGEIFFETDPSLAFPAGDIGGVSISGRQAAVRLSMLSLLGVTSPLPIGFSDYANRGRRGADPLRNFLSIMQNRLHRLWVDAHRKYSIRHRHPAVRDALRLTAFPRRTRSADELKRAVRSVWEGIPIRITENVGRWTTAENLHALGRGGRLGRGAVLGSKVYDRSAKFRISLGPLDMDTYKSFLPDGRGHQVLMDMITRYINEPLICELELSCDKRCLPPVRLGGAAAGPGGLGRTLLLGKSKVSATGKRGGHVGTTCTWSKSLPLFSEMRK